MTVLAPIAVIALIALHVLALDVLVRRDRRKANG